MREGLFIFIGVIGTRSSSETGGAANCRLVDFLPKTRWPHEGLVVEAGRKEGRKEVVYRHRVERQRGPAVLADCSEAVEKFDRRRSRVRLATSSVAQLDQSVRLVRSGRENAAGAMIFKRPADEVYAVGDQRGGKRIPRMSDITASVEAETKRLRAINEAAMCETVV